MAAACTVAEEVTAPVPFHAAMADEVDEVAPVGPFPGPADVPTTVAACADTPATMATPTALAVLAGLVPTSAGAPVRPLVTARLLRARVLALLGVAKGRAVATRATATEVDEVPTRRAILAVRAPVLVVVDEVLLTRPGALTEADTTAVPA